jgi:hypothetical protein
MFSLFSEAGPPTPSKTYGNCATLYPKNHQTLRLPLKSHPKPKNNTIITPTKLQDLIISLA